MLHMNKDEDYVIIHNPLFRAFLDDISMTDEGHDTLLILDLCCYTSDYIQEMGGVTKTEELSAAYRGLSCVGDLKGKKLGWVAYSWLLEEYQKAKGGGNVGEEADMIKTDIEDDGDEVEAQAQALDKALIAYFDLRNNAQSTTEKLDILDEAAPLLRYPFLMKIPPSMLMSQTRATLPFLSPTPPTPLFPSLTPPILLFLSSRSSAPRGILTSILLTLGTVPMGVKVP